MNRIRNNGWKTAAKVGVLALGLSMAKAVELLLTHDFIGAIREGTITAQAWFCLGMMLAAFSLAIIGSFVCVLRGRGVHLAGTVASALLATAAGLEASNWVGQMPGVVLFTGYAVTQIGMTFAFVYIICQSFNISGRLRKWPPFIAATTVALSAIVGIVSHGWRPIVESQGYMFALRDMFILGTPLFLTGFTALNRSYRLDPSDLWTSIKLRLPSSLRNRTWYQSLALIAGGALAGALWQLVSWQSDATGRFLEITFGVLCLPWIGVAWMMTQELITYIRDQRHNSLAHRLTDRQAKRFVRRYHRDHVTWAATVGLRTSSFTIDHDPDGILHSKLPASLLHIRSEEIGRCVNMVINQRRLHLHSAGHHISGTLDPEISFRPCVDVLKLFACLYLDASPLVERRIKGLTSLLPIVDPALSAMLNPNEISHTIRRNQWFFHFDFDWIDQHVIHTPKSTRYDIMVSALSTITRNAIMEQLESRGGIGNFVWMGHNARDRLLQEAPILKSIIEPYPVSLQDGTDERLMFIIKFEQLIPRLQRYFNLDRWRKALMDFDPTPENERLSNLLGLQATRSKTPDAVNDLLDSIRSVHWQGFREKDNALQLVLRAYNNINEELGLKDGMHSSRDPEITRLHRKMLETVQHVGYPSQILHRAQILKRTLREPENLIEAASRPAHPRFLEAWLLLSTADFTRYRREDRKILLMFLMTASENNKLWTFEATIFKAIDALANLGKLCGPEDIDLVNKVFSALSRRVVKNQANPDAVCLLLDTLQHLDSYLRGEVDFDKESHDTVENYIHVLQDEMGTNHPDVIAMMSRWQEFRIRSKAA